MRFLIQAYWDWTLIYNLIYKTRTLVFLQLSKKKKIMCLNFLDCRSNGWVIAIWSFHKIMSSIFSWLNKNSHGTPYMTSNPKYNNTFLSQTWKIEKNKVPQVKFQQLSAGSWRVIFLEFFFTKGLIYHTVTGHADISYFGLFQEP